MKLVVAAVFATLFFVACGWGKTACTVIDVVHDNCSWIRYLGPDGKEHEVRVDKDDLVQLGMATEARRAPKRDAGP